MSNVAVKVLLACAVVVSTSASATRWLKSEVTDPVSNGSCSVFKLGSVRAADFEDDENNPAAILYPNNSASSLWFCSSSGYISFAEDFYDVNDDERDRISGFLKKHYSPSSSASLFYRLWLAEEVYRLREKDARFWAYFYQRMAAIFESNSETLISRSNWILETEVRPLTMGELYGLAESFRTSNMTYLARSCYEAALDAPSHGSYFYRQIDATDVHRRLVDLKVDAIESELDFSACLDPNGELPSDDQVERFDPYVLKSPSEYFGQ